MSALHGSPATAACFAGGSASMCVRPEAVPSPPPQRRSRTPSRSSSPRRQTRLQVIPPARSPGGAASAPRLRPPCCCLHSGRCGAARILRSRAGHLLAPATSPTSCARLLVSRHSTSGSPPAGGPLLALAPLTCGSRALMRAGAEGWPFIAGILCITGTVRGATSSTTVETRCCCSDATPRIFHQCLYHSMSTTFHECFFQS